MLPGYCKPYRLDISDRRGGLLVYIKSHLPSRLLKNFNIPSDIQVIPFELNLREKMGVYVHLQTSFSKQIIFLRQVIRNYRSLLQYIRQFIIFGDFNMEPSDSVLNALMQSHSLFKKEDPKHLIHRDYQN